LTKTDKEKGERSDIDFRGATGTCRSAIRLDMRNPAGGKRKMGSEDCVGYLVKRKGGGV